MDQTSKDNGYVFIREDFLFSKEKHQTHTA